MRDLRTFFHYFFLSAHLVRHVLVGLILLLLFIAVILWWAEEELFGNALYLTLITGLTVGYGDISPITLVGRCASVVAALVGLIITGIYVALATNAMTRCFSDRHSDGPIDKGDRRDHRGTSGHGGGLP